MGGQLSAEPTPGGGLTMVIRLPLSSGPENAHLRSRADGRPTEGGGR
jgi:two-component system sensor histidine kinase KdpD